MISEYEKTISEAVSEIFKSLGAEVDNEQSAPDYKIESQEFPNIIFVRDNECAPWVRAIFRSWDPERRECFAINPCNLAMGKYWKDVCVKYPEDDVVVEYEDIIKIQDTVAHLVPEQVLGIIDYYL